MANWVIIYLFYYEIEHNEAELGRVYCIRTPQAGHG